MTGSANHQRFAPSLSHFLDPSRLLFPSFLFEVCQLANMMHFYVRARATEFACIRKKSFDEFVGFMSSLLREVWIEIGENCSFLSSQRDASELCHQWLLSVFSLNNDLEAG